MIDQFSRNLFRDKPDAYYYDRLAIFLSKELIHLKLHQKLNKYEKIFTFMPFMHSKIFEDQIISLSLNSNLGIKENFRSVLKHLTLLESLIDFLIGIKY